MSACCCNNVSSARTAFQFPRLLRKPLELTVRAAVSSNTFTSQHTATNNEPAVLVNNLGVGFGTGSDRKQVRVGLCLPKMRKLDYQQH